MFRNLFENTTATLKKKFPNVIFRLSAKHPPEDQENAWYSLGMVLVKYKERKQGIATEFMKELITLAKKEKADIFLTPDDSYQEPGDMTKKDLEKWYKKLGFKKKRSSDFRSQNTMCFYT